MLIRSRVVLPISQPAIENGAVAISGSQITAVGRWTDLASKTSVLDLGDSIVLPGLINAHCHLDYTSMAGQIAAAKSFPDWIKSILALKAQWSYADYALSWLHGAKMLLARGVTTVADIEAVPELLSEVWTATPLRVLSFLEMTGIKSQRPAAAILREAEAKILSLRSSKRDVGLSPHAPYSTSPALLRLTGRTARRNNWRVTTHVAESAAEFEMFMYRRGPLFDWLKPQRDMNDCGHGSPVQHLARNHLLGPNALAVHVNYLWDNDAHLLGETGTHVVHCPRSHAYFGHQRFPRLELSAQGVNICLGTDSLASAKRERGERLELDMFAEMRALAAKSSDLSSPEILQMATLNGARALGLEGKLGELRAGSFADLIAIPFDGTGKDVYDAVLRHGGAVSASMIDGKWVIAP